jgi:hypothetical protein
MDHLVPKLSGTGYAVRAVLQISKIDTLKLVYFACFHSLMKCGVIY